METNSLLPGFRVQYMSEFGSEEKDHRRIVDPDDDCDQRPGSAISRTDSGFTQVDSNQKFPGGEQNGRDACANPNNFPANPGFRQVSEDQREQYSGSGQRDCKVDCAWQNIVYRQEATEEFAYSRKES